MASRFAIRTSSRPISSGLKTISARPDAIAASGMPEFRAELVVCTNAIPPSALMAANPRAPVRIVAGQDHCDGVGVLCSGETLKEEVDGHPSSGTTGARSETEGPLLESHCHIRRNNIDVIGSNQESVLCLEDGHLCGSSQQFREQAALFRSQVLYDYERHSRRWGTFERSAVNASRPPADAPIPTIGNGAFGRSWIVADVFRASPGLPCC